MTNKQGLHFAQVVIGALYILVGAAQANAQLFGARWSGVVMTGGGVLMALLIYLRTQVADPPPVL